VTFLALCGLKQQKVKIFQIINCFDFNYTFAPLFKKLDKEVGIFA